MAPRKPRKKIGLILPNASNRYCITLIEEFSHSFHNKGYELLVALSAHDIEKERELITYFHKITDGILIMSNAENYDQLADIVPSNIPTIFLNRKPQGCTHTCVIENNYSAVYQEFFSLRSNSHEKIGCICTQPYFSTNREIVQAYLDALSLESTEDPNCFIRYTYNDPSNLQDLIRELHAAGCTAIFAASQTLTEHMIDFLSYYNRSLEVPLVGSGFANHKHFAFYEHAIDLVEQPLAECISLATQQLIYRIDNPHTPSRDFVLKGTLKKHFC